MLTPLDVIARLSIAALLGGVVGIEREYRSKPAGLRTHMMVSLGAACFTLAAFGLAEEVSPDLAVDSTVVDPTRVVQGIIGGIGFLGAGAIIRNRASIEGLTTAGSIWLAGAVGIAAGAGNHVLAGAAVLAAVIILALVGWAEHRWSEGSQAGSGSDER